MATWQEEETRTVFRAGLQLPVIPTASLPAASTDLNGFICVEDTGTTHNLVIYGARGPERVRITGTEF